MKQPIWCRCNKHSWTRRQLYNAWLADRSVRCPETECGREISIERIEELLVSFGMVKIDKTHTDTK